MTYCVHRLGGATAHDHILSYWNTCWAISLSCNVAKGKRIKYGLDHRTLGPLDNFFWTICWTIFFGPSFGPFYLGWQTHLQQQWLYYLHSRQARHQWDLPKSYRVHQLKGRQSVVLHITDLVSITFILSKVLFLDLLIEWRINTSVAKCINHPLCGSSVVT